MKLKAPPGVGDPCVAGVAIVSRDGIYEVEPDAGALLIEAFGFAEVKAGPRAQASPAAVNAAASAPSVPRRGPPFPKLTHPAWRTKPASKEP